MARQRDSDSSVPLPPGLDITAIRRTIKYIERELTDLVEIYHEQANVFSAVLGIYATRGLDANSIYEKSRVDVAFLEKTDWKYEPSKAGAAGGGRTHTFGLSNPATKLAGKAVYSRSDVRIAGGKAVPAGGD